MATTTPQINLKGIREGLLLTVEGSNLAQALPYLRAELERKQGFLQGSQVVWQAGSRQVERAELDAVQGVLAAHGLTLWAVLSEDEGTRAAARLLGLATRLPGSDTDLEGNRIGAAEVVAEGESVPEPLPLGNALLLQDTLRSGRSVYHDGHIIILGDVNPGAEVIAGGNVIVWGRLRGLVHAGAHGDRQALICALELAPTQLRIADQIAIPPTERPNPPRPEAAAIREEMIVAEPWRRREP